MAGPTEFRGKAALITGSSGGVGFRVAEQLAAAGASVFINGRSAERGAQAEASLRESGYDVRFIAGDCASYQDAAAVVGTACSSAGRLDILISAGAAGEAGPTPFADLTPQQIENEFRMLLMPRIFPVHAALPALRENGGSVVLLTTEAGRTVTPGESVLGAVGASVIMLTKTLAKELGRFTIRVNSVALSLTSDTPTWDRLRDGEGFERELFTKLVARFPFGRAPSADEAAAVAVFLASAAAAPVTGQTISVTGGLSFGGW
ncbi:MAG TPA: SDR family oxidoreductase [Actinophytocola sp.]|nr:SDR family oxidoreductase [Actinophytocola sp.]